MCEAMSEGREAEMDALCNEIPQEKQCTCENHVFREGVHLPGCPMHKTAPMPKYEPKTIEDCISHLFEVMSFEELIIWANQLEVLHYEEDWLKDEWAEREEALRQEVEEVFGALIN